MSYVKCGVCEADCMKRDSSCYISTCLNCARKIQETAYKHYDAYNNKSNPADGDGFLKSNASYMQAIDFLKAQRNIYNKENLKDRITRLEKELKIARVQFNAQETIPKIKEMINEKLVSKR